MEYLSFTNYGVKEVSREEAEKLLGYKFTTRYGDEIPDSEVQYVDLDSRSRIAEMRVGPDGVDGRTYQYRGDGKMRIRANTNNAFLQDGINKKKMKNGLGRLIKPFLFLSIATSPRHIMRRKTKKKRKDEF